MRMSDKRLEEIEDRLPETVNRFQHQFEVNLIASELLTEVKRQRKVIAQARLKIVECLAPKGKMVIVTRWSDVVANVDEAPDLAAELKQSSEGVKG